MDKEAYHLGNCHVFVSESPQLVVRSCLEPCLPVTTADGRNLASILLVASSQDQQLQEAQK